MACKLTGASREWVEIVFLARVGHELVKFHLRGGRKRRERESGSALQGEGVDGCGREEKSATGGRRGHGTRIWGSTRYTKRGAERK